VDILLLMPLPYRSGIPNMLLYVVVLNGLYKIVHGLSISAEMYDLE